MFSVIKSERRTLRSSFSNCLKKFYDAVKEGDNDATGKAFFQLKDKHARLTAKDSEYLKVKGTDPMTEADEKELDNDLKQAEEYHDKMAAATYEFEQLTTGKEKCQSTSRKVETEKTTKLPRIQFEAFHLTPRTWLAFWSQYKKVYEDDRLDFTDKFQYLLMSLKDGPAKEMVSSYPRDDENLAKVVESLKHRYGRDTLLIEIYTREIIALLSNECTSLSKLYDQLNAHLLALGGLGMTSNKCAFILYPLVEGCIPTELRKVWERQRRGSNLDRSSLASLPSAVEEEENPLDKLMQFLQDEVHSEERIQRASQMIPKKDDHLPPRQTAAMLVSQSVTKKVSCLFCEKSHASQDCFKAQAMTLQEREAIITKRAACYRCLLVGHRIGTCKVKVRCLICSKSHYTLMCKDREQVKDKPKNDQPDEKEKHEKGVNGNKSHANFSSGAVSYTYLKTLIINIHFKDKIVPVRALLDDGAQKSYLVTDIINKLKLEPVRKEFISHGLFGGVNGTSKEHWVYRIKVSGLKSSDCYEITVVEQGAICSELMRPSQLRDPGLFEELELKGVELSDIGENPPPVEMLLGADVIGKLHTGNMHVLTNGITAIETKLGWSVLGASSKRAKSIITSCISFCNPQAMWELEAIGIKEPIVDTPDSKKKESDALEQFQHSLKKVDGRYMVELPWIPGHPPLPDNFMLARKRLEGMTNKLKREGYYDDYNAVFQQWLDEKIIEKVNDEEDSSTIRHFLPHRPVIRPDKESSRIRPVFDASAGNVSLNDCLYKGRNMLQQIPTLLTKFRLGKYGLTGDIKQAFLQLMLSDKDKDALRFLWWSDDEVIVLRHCRVVFGVTSSPFLLNATISYHLEEAIKKEISETIKELLKKLKESYYVDDSISSFNDEKQLLLFISTANNFMSQANFELRRWTSNSTCVENEKNKISVLGMQWDLITDEIYCVGVQEKVPSGPITKRSLLRLVNAVYDPIGILCPAMLTPRIILQESWKNKELGWDDALPIQMQRDFDAWATNITDVEEVRIPRWMCADQLEKGTFSLQIFCDASNKGYGCCIFLRHKVGDIVKVQLVAAKARVAPLQAQTIPRMELLAACVAVRLYKSMKDVFGIHVPVIFWTDSMTALSWITSALTWGTFVGNRVKEIRNGSEIETWRHVPGTMNPADVCSRGCTFQTLLSSKWWKGPAWLKDENKWPNSQKIECTEEALIELKDKKTGLEEYKIFLNNLLVTNSLDCEDFLIDVTRYFSSYMKILRMVAWIFRLRCKTRPKTPLHVEEILAAERKLILLVQKIRDCHVQGVKTNRDKEGLLRIGSRVVDSQRETSLIVLPSDHIIVTRLIEQAHREVQHAGVGTTLAKIRERFWLIKGRTTVGSVLKNCGYCRLFTSKKCLPEPAALPVERTSAKSFAFQATGVDLFGPMFLQDDQKVWGILFTCAVFRCIRLDLVEAISTEAFIRALRRFLARNNCHELYSDRGTNFVGFSNLLQVLEWDKIEEFASTRRLKMSHAPPNAPWYGGFFERLVGVVKQSLRKQLGKAKLTKDELYTVFTECESIVNSRPLTYVSNDANDFSIITPAHFLQEVPGNGAPELDVLDSQSVIERVQYVQQVRKEIRERFVKEYLNLLVHRPLKGKVTPVEVGDIVLIEVENKKRMLWPLGRVMEIFPGRDGNCRVARIKTQRGELIRPFQRLYPLEVKAPKDEDLVPVENEEIISEDVSKNNEDCNGSTVPIDPTENNSTCTRVGRIVKKPKRFED